MPLRKNKALISFFDFLGRFIFFIPILFKRILTTKHLFSLRKILVIELWGIGDLITMSPILKSLKDSFPEAKVTLLCKSFGTDLFKYNPYVDAFVEFDFPWTQFSGKYMFWNWDWRSLIKIIKILRRQRFDLTLDARGDIRNNALSFFIGAKKRIGYNYTGGGYFLTDVIPWEYDNQHRIDSWINLLNYLGLTTDNARPYLHIGSNEKAWADELLETKNVMSQDLLIGIHPGARIKTRRWPLDRFAEVAGRIRDTYKAKIIVFIEPDGYAEHIPIKGDFIKIKTSLGEVIALIKRLTLLICNDTGIMHIATAVDIPVVAIFGPTISVWFSPYGDNNSIVFKENIKCRPCFDYCQYKEPFCLTGISVDEVLKEVDKKIPILFKR